MVWQTKKLRVKNIGEKQEIETVSKKSDDSRRKEKVDTQEIKEFYEQKKDFSRLEKPTVSLSFWIIIILCLIFGSLGGLITNVFILKQGNIKLPFIGEVNLSKIFPNREITLVTEKNITITTDLRLADLSNKLKPQLMNVFQMKEETEAVPVLEQVYLDKDVISQAGVLTADGWLISAGNLDPEVNTYVVLNRENKIFKVKKIVKDPLTGLNFLKIEAKDLQVINFISSKEEIIQGKEVILFDHSMKIFTDILSCPSYLKVNKKEDLIRSTDYFSEGTILEHDYLKPEFLGSFIFGLDGLILGIVAEKKNIPYWQFERAVNAILEKGEINRNYLGINYLRIEDLVGAEREDLSNVKKGAIIYGDPAGVAEKAGLKDGDVIVKIDSTPLDEKINLTELIQKKKPGEEIKMTILREGKEKEYHLKISN